MRKEVPSGVDGLIDTAGIAEPASRAVRDGGRVATSRHGIQVSGDRGIVVKTTFPPLLETGGLRGRVVPAF
ncbi:hypothetical protein EEJ42_27275 [Streptomyces botrytidirepellens]|uniref:Uncharacterized protein n=1 Tax=Streptomyces botrytidirepellens TaxID=2486417 RepID=A0A3M8VND4_9ACTN|nr:hypothetical protein EEJ42_27275 [Streptomyces botrytidirepellens]